MYIKCICMESRKMVLMNLFPGWYGDADMENGLWTQCGREKMGQIERVVTYNGMSLSFKKNTFASVLMNFQTVSFREWASPVAQVVKNLPVMQETQEMGVQSLSWEDSPTGGNGNPL